MKANLRRHSSTKPSEADEKDINKNDITIGDLTIHPDAYYVSKSGETIELTHREFELLHYLAIHVGQVMTMNIY